MDDLIWGRFLFSQTSGGIFIFLTCDAILGHVFHCKIFFSLEVSLQFFSKLTYTPPLPPLKKSNGRPERYQ